MFSCTPVKKALDPHTIKEFCVDNATILSALAAITVVAGALAFLQVHGMIDFKSSFSSYTAIGGGVGAVTILAIKAIIEKCWHRVQASEEKLNELYWEGHQEGTIKGQQIAVALQDQSGDVSEKATNPKPEKLGLQYRKFYKTRTFIREHQKPIFAILTLLAVTAIVLLQYLNIIHLEKLPLMIKGHYPSIVVGGALGSITTLVIKILLDKNTEFFYKKSVKTKRDGAYLRGLQEGQVNAKGKPPTVDIAKKGHFFESDDSDDDD